MKKCPFCAEQIQDEAMVCRFCGRDLRASPQVIVKKSKAWIWIVVGVLGLMIVVCLVIFSAMNNAGTSISATVEAKAPAVIATAKKLPTSAQAAIRTETPVKTRTYNIGDAVKIGDLVMTVNGMEFSNGDDTWQPEYGHKYVIVDVTFENQGKELVSLSSLMQMSLKDSTGQEYTEDMGADISSGNKSPGGEIIPGDKLRGKLGYEFPNEALGFRFGFDSSLFSGGKVFVDLGK